MGAIVTEIDDLDDPTVDWDCAPSKDDDSPVISDWMREYVKQHVISETNSLSWVKEKKFAGASRSVIQRCWPRPAHKIHLDRIGCLVDN